MKLSWSQTQLYAAALTIICGLLEQSIIVYGQINVPGSPCPKIFSYGYDGQSMFGQMRIPSPQLGGRLHLMLEMSLGTSLPSSYVGTLELAYSRPETLQRIINRQDIEYRVVFPLTSPIPKVTSIVVNGRTICTGPGEQTRVTTNIRLEHMLFTEGANNQEGESSNFNSDNSFENLQPTISFSNNNFNPQAAQNTQNNNNFGVNRQPEQQQRPQQVFETQQRPLVQQNNVRPQVRPQVKPRPQQQPQFQPQPLPQREPEPQVVVPPKSDIPSSVLANARDEDICGIPDASSQYTPLITGGRDIERGDWPWLSAIYSTDSANLQFICGGTLISKRVVVTAAHCVNSGTRLYSSQDLLVYLGRYNIRKWELEPGVVTKEVLLVQNHPDYMRKRNSFDADIAILLFRTEVQYSEFIRPICLWRGSSDVRSIEGKMGKVVGWGRDLKTMQLTSSVPKEIDIPVVPQDTCIFSHQTISVVSSNRTFCAGKRDNTGPCNGDSGGTLALKVNNRWMLRGVVSVGIPNEDRLCDLQNYIVFTDAAQFLPWIQTYVSI